MYVGAIGYTYVSFLFHNPKTAMWNMCAHTMDEIVYIVYLVWITRNLSLFKIP